MAAIIRKILAPLKAPKAIGPYSAGVVVDRTVYISGQLGVNPETMDIVPGGVEEEARQALINLGVVLESAGSGYENVVKTTVLLADMNDFARVNEIYAKFFPSRCPARACYQVSALPKNARVEIEAIAVLGPILDS